MPEWQVQAESGSSEERLFLVTEHADEVNQWLGARIVKSPGCSTRMGVCMTDRGIWIIYGSLGGPVSPQNEANLMD